MAIRQLPPNLINRIAAGEVVERPASVVKELVENALDAEAGAITVEMVEGGRERIRVVDDGVGMDREDALMCVRRHATSKLRRFEDLGTLRTMGFRGEALASIASVSRFRLLTRQREAVAATEVRVEGGAAPVVRDAGAPPGTTVEVDELFFNVPARRKFLRARQTESHHIAETVLKAALAHPQIRFALTSNGRRIREYLPALGRLARAQAVFDDQKLVPIEASQDDVGVVAALGPPERARSGARHLYLFVNDRPVIDRALARAIAFSYGDRLAKGKYPAGVLFLSLPPGEVDVNAHPQKTEIRFARASRVLDAVTRLLTRELGTRRWAGGIEGTAAESSVRPAAKPAGPASSGGPAPSLRRDGFWSERLAAGPGTRTSTGAGGKKGGVDPTPPAAPSDPWGLGSALAGPTAPEATPEGPAGEDSPRDGAPRDGAVREKGPRYGASAAGSAGGEAARADAPIGDSAGPAARSGGASSESVPRGSAPPAEAPRPLGTPAPERAPEPAGPRLLACLDGDLWLGDDGAGLLVVDGTRLARALTLAAWPDEAALPSRRLLFPARVDLDAEDAARVESERDVLEALGLEVTAVGPTTFAIHTVPRAHPQVGGEPPAEAVLRAALGALAADADAPARRAAIAAALVPRARSEDAAALFPAAPAHPEAHRRTGYDELRAGFDEA